MEYIIQRLSLVAEIQLAEPKRFDLGVFDSSTGRRVRIGVPPTLTMLLDPCLHIFAYRSAERSMTTAENINRPILPSPSLHSRDHS